MSLDLPPSYEQSMLDSLSSRIEVNIKDDQYPDATPVPLPILSNLLKPPYHDNRYFHMGECRVPDQSEIKLWKPNAIDYNSVCCAVQIEIDEVKDIYKRSHICKNPVKYVRLITIPNIPKADCYVQGFLKVSDKSFLKASDQCFAAFMCKGHAAIGNGYVYFLHPNAELQQADKYGDMPTINVRKKHCIIM